MKRGKRRVEKPTTVSQTVRRAVLDSGVTLYRVAKDARVSYAVLHRFVSGKRGLSIETLDKVCHYLGLKLVRAEE
jgi:hypothetical protein